MIESTPKRSWTLAGLSATRCAIGSVILSLAVLPSCGGGGGGGGGGGSGVQPGVTLPNPNTGLLYVVEQNQGGQANSMTMTGLWWGRLVDIYDQDPITAERTQLFENFVIGQTVESNGVDYLLERNPVTERESLTILHKYGTAAFENAFFGLESSLQPFLDKSLDPSELPPFTAVPRNAAIVARFNDLLADGGDRTSPNYPGTVTDQNVQVRVGTPPVAPFSYRLIPDPNHGDTVNGVFHSTRVILDMTVSALEAKASGLQVNSLGLPASQSQNQANLVLRFPTITNSSAAQFGILQNLGGKGVGFGNNGSTDPFSPTLDVVRAARTGGTTQLTGDANNGFLKDDIKPEVLGAQAVSVTSFTGPTGPNGDLFLVDITFSSTTCASKPIVGDVIQLQTDQVLEVTQNAGVPINGQVSNVPVRVVFGDPTTLFPVIGQFRTTWDLSSGALPECFFRFSPPAGSPPNIDVAVDAGVVLSFSEPMDPATITPLETFRLEYDNNPAGGNPLYDAVVGVVAQSADLVTYTLDPAQPLRHQQAGESYTFKLGAVTDLAGNTLETVLPPVGFTLNPNQPLVDSISASLNFASPNEDGDPLDYPEVRGGQISFDLSKGLVRPRSVNRFSAPADETNITVARMIPINQKIQTPLSNLGSRMMSVWRPDDFGFSLLDENDHNLDLEAIYWEPFGGTVQIDIFPEFQISVSHSINLPDEHVDGNLLPEFPKSGLANKFDNNVPDGESMVVVAPRTGGYLVHPLDIIPGQAGKVLVPWPMNQDISVSEYQYWTYRDTSKVFTKGGQNGNGVDTKRVQTLSGQGFNKFWDKGKVPSIGLPLLMDFRTYSNSVSSGQNGFRIAIAINSSANPYFRTFSTGGVINGVPTTIDPDQEASGGGGINPNNSKKTPSQDNTFYYGQADFVVRVSRTHTIWFDMQGIGASTFADPFVGPATKNQPSNTSVVLAFRGASDITSPTPGTWTNALNFDPYGESYDERQHCWLADGTPGCDGGIVPNANYGAKRVFTPTYFPDDSWYDSPSDVNGARFIQARVTMISDPETGLSPVLSGLGFSALQ